ncbi:hypothetical protein [Lysinibacillus capsici]|uniref:hypothetical protein n=1 Tax=Lysinibacillus capsici TaxID=2115968 RepID=UPI000E208465|nr:hypothetical protein [Lysinibacillus capsici]RDV27757.1 hypothetical protein C7B89_19450 [Lysinibacillus capsici]
MKRYTIGLNVNDSSELLQAATDIQAFIDTLGVASELDIQVSVNPLLSQSENTNVIGFAMKTEEDYEEDEE